MDTRNADAAQILRATFEYEEAINLLKRKREVQAYLQAIDKELRSIKRLSHRVFTLARQDMESAGRHGPSAMARTMRPGGIVEIEENSEEKPAMSIDHRHDGIV